MMEVDKIIEVRDEAAILSEFLDWLEEREFQICIWKDPVRYSWSMGGCVPAGFYPRQLSNEQLLADYFEIDLEKVELEREEILGQMRENHENHEN